MHCTCNFALLLIALQWIINKVKIDSLVDICDFSWQVFDQQNCLQSSQHALQRESVIFVLLLASLITCSVMLRVSVRLLVISLCGSIRNILESCQHWLLRLHFYSLCICQMLTVLLHLSHEFVNWSNEASDDLKNTDFSLCKALWVMFELYLPWRNLNPECSLKTGL